MKTRTARFTAIFLAFAAMETPALAYLDGATGSIILQATIGIVASWMVYYRLFKEKARAFISRLAKKSPSNTNGQ